MTPPRLGSRSVRTERNAMRQIQVRGRRRWQSWFAGAVLSWSMTAGLACERGPLEESVSESGGASSVSSSSSGGGGPAPLSSVSVPRAVGGDIVDSGAAIRLGKALFWDTQVG